MSTEINDNEIPQDSGTKPRPAWRRGARPRISFALAAIGIAAAFLALAIVAPPVEAATWQDAVIAGAVTGGTVGAIGGTMIPGIGTAAGALIGTTVGATAALVGWLLGDKTGDQQASAQAMAKWLAHEQRNNTDAKLALAQTNAENIAELAQRAITYYERSSYYASVKLYQQQTADETAHIYDSDYVLDEAKVSDEMVGSVSGSYAVYNKVLKQLDTVGSNYFGDYAGNSATIRAQTAYSTSVGATINYDSQLYIRLTSFCNTPAGKYVWLNATDTVILWNLGAATQTGNVVIKDHADNIVYSQPVTLTASGGYGIDLSGIGIESGRYNVQLPDAKWIWSANAAEDYINSGTVAPGIAVYSARSGDLVFSWGWANLPGNQGFSASGSWSFSSGYPWKSAALDARYANGGWPYISYNYPDGTKTASAEIIDLRPYIESMHHVSRSWRQITYAASLAGQTAYQVLVDNGGVGTDGTSADVLYPPTYLLMPDYDQLNKMTPQQLLSTYYAYLNQLNETFAHNTIMRPESVNVSTDSFDLLIRGYVWNPAGDLVIGPNTPFTLYTTLDGLALRSGENSTLVGPGYMVTWADGYSSLMDYIGAKGNVASPNVTYRDVGAGWIVRPLEMTFENQIVQQKNLTVDTLDTYVPPDLSNNNPPPQGDDKPGWWDANWPVLGIVAGAVLIVVGIMQENTSATIVGLVALLVCGAAWYLYANPIDLSPKVLGSQIESLRLWLAMR